MSFAVDQYLADQASRGLKACTTERAEYHLKSFLQLEDNGHRRIRWVLGKGAALYQSARERTRANDTHRNALLEARMWANFCVGRGWLPSNPFAGVKGVGKRKHGKPKLRIDESRTWMGRGLAMWRSNKDRGAITAVATLIFGARSGEVWKRRVRDLDDRGRVLWIPDSKTETGKRALEVPALLQKPLRELARGKDPDAYLFTRQNGDPPTKDWLHYHVTKLCRLAKVPRVTPHGLRNTHATIADAAGTTPHVLAAALGHASPEITRTAYIDRTSRSNKEARTVLKVIDGGRGKFSADSSYQPKKRAG